MGNVLIDICNMENSFIRGLCIIHCKKKHVPRIFISLYLYLRYKFRSSTVADKQLSVSLCLTPVHLSASADFANIFIRYKQSTAELSLVATEMVFTTVFSQ